MEFCMSLVDTRTELSADAALKRVKSAIAFAEKNGWQICAAACDSRGVALAMWRTDRVIDPAIGFAADKAYTAAVLRRPTAAFAERALSRPPLALGLANRDRLLVFPGGLPVMMDSVCIGGLGVSGAADEEDVQCALHALAEAGLS